MASTDVSRAANAGDRLRPVRVPPPAGGGEPESRGRLRSLDSCLQVLEDAHERDETWVSPALAAQIGRHLPKICPGMLIKDGIGLSLREQEQYLRLQAEDDDEGESESVHSPFLEEDRRQPRPDDLGQEEAEVLTERIRHTSGQVCMLLLEAYERRAATALRYQTWAQYVLKEFGMSRPRSYELLEQARVLRAVAAATGMSGIPDISAYAAGQIKPN